MAKSRGSREFRTTSHLLRAKPDEVREIDPPPKENPPEGRCWKSRLSWTADVDRSFDPALFRKNIELPYNRDVVHVLDANMFLHPTDDRIWEGLLNGRGRLAIAEPILEELDLWLAGTPEFNERVHAALRDLRVRPERSPIAVLKLPEKGTPRHAMLEYYTHLVGARKRAYEMISRKLNGIGLTGHDRELISKICRQEFGERTQRAGKERRDFSEPVNLNDETMIILAIEGSLFSGREFSIFTRDEGLFEQFYKTVWLLDTHYRGLLLGKCYQQNYQAFETLTVTSANCATEEGRNYFKQFFVNDSLKLLRRPSFTMHEVLPEQFTMLSWHCSLFRDDRATVLSFAGETLMRRVLEAKGCSGGLTSPHIEPKNLHIWLGPLMNEFGNYAGIADDRCIELEHSRIGILDFVLSMHSKEGVSRHIYKNEAS
jgi:hypothetical protein